MLLVILTRVHCLIILQGYGIHITDRDQHMIWHQQAQQTIDNYFSSPQFHTAYYINLDRSPQERKNGEEYRTVVE